MGKISWINKDKIKKMKRNMFKWAIFEYRIGNKCKKNWFLKNQ